MASNWVALGVQALSSIFGKRSAQKQSAQAYATSLKDAKKFYKYTSKNDMKNALNEMAKEYAYQSKLMSNSANATVATNKKLMDYQYALERQSRQSSYQDTRKDLEGAGYNPLLAVGQQSNYTPVSSNVSADSADVEGANLATSRAGVMSAINSAMNETSATRSQVKRNDVLNAVDEATAQTNAQKVLAEIGQINSATDSNNIQNMITSLTGLNKANAEIDEIMSRTGLNKAQQNRISKEISLMGIQSALYSAQAQNEREKQGMIVAQKSSAISQAQIDKQTQGVIKRHPYLHGFNALGITPAIGNTVDTLINAGSRMAGKGRR